MKSLLRFAVLALLIHVPSFASDSSETVFKTPQSLQGNWSIQSGMKTLPIQMSYEAGSKGSIVSERFGKELSVFYRDGGAIQMIHFCNAGNQPRLRLKDPRLPDLLEFETFEVSNLSNPTADHVQRVIYRLTGNTRMDLEIVWVSGKSESSEKYTLTRL